ncbi:MAG TPA: VOC family protein [Candidatus Sulfotelmatobacter sp.]|nr:VOC family protein [Candidatus Sulfotelmatobacter sp.]
MSEKQSAYEAGRFCWNELVAADEGVARKFYAGLFGWRTEAFGGSTEYTLFKKGADTVGGMMKCPQPGLPSHWLPYVTVDDVDAAVALARQLGGRVVVDPFDVPTVGRLAVLVDPQGAAIAILKPAM